LGGGLSEYIAVPSIGGDDGSIEVKEHCSELDLQEEMTKETHEKDA
jgi:hypothetical protein